MLLCDLSVNSASCSAWLSLAEAAHLCGRKLLLRMTDYAITCEDIPLAPEIVYITLHEEPIR